MNGPTPDDIFDFLGGKTGPGADRVRRAVRQPGTDPAADDALTLFRKHHRDLENAPVIRKAVEATVAKWKAAFPDRDQWPAAAAVADWRPHYDKLLAHCRAELEQAAAAPSADTAAGLASTVLSSYIRGVRAGEYGDLNNPNHLWPVLMTIAARKLKQKLNAKVVTDRKFEAKLREALDVAVNQVAGDDHQRLILVHALFGREPGDIARLTGGRDADVKNDLRELHGKLLYLTAA